VEGENDDISGVGQTRAAQTLCSSLADDMRMHYMQPDVGHYGVFNGSRFRKEIAPRILKFMNDHSMAARAATKPAIRVIEGGRRRMAASGK
jgi:poly(3-hydroxybutyrate) depolymerase